MLKNNKNKLRIKLLEIINNEKDIKKKDGKWATINEIQNMIKDNIFSESHKNFFNDCLKYLNANK